MLRPNKANQYTATIPHCSWPTASRKVSGKMKHGSVRVAVSMETTWNATTIHTLPMMLSPEGAIDGATFTRTRRNRRDERVAGIVASYSTIRPPTR